MPTYLLTYHGGGMNETEEEQARAMAAWGAWMTGLGAALVDVGKPVVLTATVSSDGSSSPGGGPNPVTGYSVVTADDLDAAVALVAGCPVLASGGSVEVGETVDVM
ncbi:MAG: YciI family protein [Actinomycetes bacterium]